MSGVKGRSGRGTHKQAVDFSMLQRYSLAYLLRKMREYKDSPEKFKIALEVTSKGLTKPISIDQSHHNHVSYIWENGTSEELDTDRNLELNAP